MQAVESVAGKSTDGLSDDHVDISGHALVDHTIEFVTFFRVGAGDTVVCKYARQLPFRILLNVLDVYKRQQQGYVLDITEQRLHHEIYLSDARKVAPEKLKTVIRHPIRER